MHCWLSPEIPLNEREKYKKQNSHSVYKKKKNSQKVKMATWFWKMAGGRKNGK
jgi:hypothetical protein